MRKNTIVGIDIGTFYVKVVISQIQENGTPPHIIGTGSALSRGLRHGYITSQHDITESIKKAVAQAEKEAGLKVDRAYVSIGGVGLEDKYSQGAAIVSRANSEVSEIDTENALAEAEALISRELLNRKVIHAIPVSYLLDGKQIFGRPVGMHGSKLEVEALFVTVLEQHLDDIIAVIESSGIETIDIMAAPIAASLVTLTKQQKMVGCVLANIGAETLSIAVFEENTPISLKVFPIGSTDITNDIALGLRLPLPEAEQLKRGVVTGEAVPQKKLDEIIAAKLRQMFTLVQDHLKKINRAGLLPAGIILTGGGSGIATIEDYARIALKLPSETTGLRLGEQQLKDASWAVAYGLCIWGASSDADTIGIENARAAGMKFFSWFKQFLP
ncbi:MAG: cell division protein FtsA [Parcubacteria group bacterium]|nr:cell division protein FtsA [Parcubacteria group bacterium]